MAGSGEAARDCGRGRDDDVHTLAGRGQALAVGEVAPDHVDVQAAQLRVVTPGPDEAAHALAPRS